MASMGRNNCISCEMFATKFNLSIQVLKLRLEISPQTRKHVGSPSHKLGSIPFPYDSRDSNMEVWGGLRVPEFPPKIEFPMFQIPASVPPCLHTEVQIDFCGEIPMSELVGTNTQVPGEGEVFWRIFSELKDFF